MSNPEREKPVEEWKIKAHEAALETRSYLLQFRDSELGSDQAEFAKKRAHESFEQFVLLTRPWLRRIVAPRAFYNEEDIVEIEQNVYERAYRGLVKFRGDAQVTSWMYTIALHRLSDYFRAKAKRLGHEVFADELPDYQSTTLGIPEQLFENEERREEVVAILSQIKDPHRRAIVYMHGFGYAQSEVGNILGATPNHVRQMVFKGLNAAREKVGHKKDSSDTPEP